MPNQPNPNALTDREAIIDTLLRFVEGLDTHSTSLVHSAFTVNAVVDLRPISNIGLSFPELVGADNAVAGLSKAVGELDISHHLSNFRVTVTGDKGHLTCYALAQHFKAGEGPKAECRGFLMGNRYQVDLVRGQGEWRMRRLVVSCMWSEGNIGVLKKES